MVENTLNQSRPSYFRNPFEYPQRIKPGFDDYQYYDRATKSYRYGPTFGQTLQAQIAYAYDPLYERAKLFFDEKAQKVDENFNPTEMPDYERYVDFSDTLNKANNEYHYKKIITNIQDSFERRRILMDSSLVSQLAAGFFDPINFVALPFGGPAFGIGRSALRVGLGTASLQAGAEALRHPFDPLSTPTEVAFNIFGAGVAGGILGGLISIPMSRRAVAENQLVTNIKETSDRFRGSSTVDSKNINMVTKEYNDILNIKIPEEIKNKDAGWLKQQKDLLIKDIERLEKRQKETEGYLKKLTEVAKITAFDRLRPRDVPKNIKIKLKELSVTKKDLEESIDLSNPDGKFTKQINEIKKIDGEITYLKKQAVDQVIDQQSFFLRGDDESPENFFEKQITPLKQELNYVEIADFQKKIAFEKGEDLSVITPRIGGKALAKITNFGPLKAILNKPNNRLIKLYGLKLGMDQGLLLETHVKKVAAKLGDENDTGSVFLDAKPHQGEVIALYKELSDLWVKGSGNFTLGYNATNAARKVKNIMPFGNKEELFEEFLDRIGNKYISKSKDLTREESKAVELVRKFFERWDGRLQETGILGNLHEMKVRAAQFKDKISKTENSIDELLNKIAVTVSRTANYASSNTTKKKQILDSLEEQFKTRGLTEKQQALRDNILEFIESSEGKNQAKINKTANTKAFKEELDLLNKIIKQYNLSDEAMEFIGMDRSDIVRMPISEIRNAAKKNKIPFKETDSILQIRDKLRRAYDKKRKNTVDLRRLQPENFETYFENLLPLLGDKLRGAFVGKTRAISYYRQKLLENEAGIKAAENKIRNIKGEILDEVFFPRYWNKDYIRANRAKLAGILKKWIQEPNIKEDGSLDFPNARVWTEDTAIDEFTGLEQTRWNQKELSIDDIEVDARVENIIDSILGENDFANPDNTYFGAGKSKHLKHRKLDIPNELVAEFIETDVAKVMFAYVQRTAPMYEFKKKFGLKDIDEVLIDIEEAGQRVGQSTKSIQEDVMNFKHLYDRIVGTLIKNPDRLDNKMALILRRAAETNFLGSAGLAALSEPSKILMEHETKVFFKSMFDMIDSNLKNISRKDVDLSGEANDTVLGSLHMRQVSEEVGNPLRNGIWDKARDVFYALNGLGPITNTFKFWDSIARSHKIIDLSVKISKKQKITDQDAQFMAQAGITDDLAIRIAKQPFQKSNRDLYVGNTEKWKDQEATVAFRRALNGGVMNTILMGTPADKPILMDGIVYVRLETMRKAGFKNPVEDAQVKGYTRIESGILAMPLQFYSYAFAAVNKITLAYANGTAKNRATAAAMAMILAYMSLKIKTPEWAWDKMSYSDKFARSFDQSGLAALYSDIYYTSMHTINAFNGPDIGLGIIGPKYRDTASEAVIGITGAAPSIGFTYAQALKEMLVGDTGAGAKDLIRALPFMRVYWWKDSVNEMTNALDAKID